MFLAQDEKVINEWEYAVSKNKKDVTVHTLTVTNKRIVATDQSPSEVMQREIPISSVQNVAFMHYKPSILGAVLLVIFGILIMVAGLFLPKLAPVEPYFLAIPVVLGLIVLIVGISKFKKSSFVVSLTAHVLEERSLLSLGVENRKALKVSSKNNKFEVKVNNDAANEIMDTLGAIIAQYRN